LVCVSAKTASVSRAMLLIKAAAGFVGNAKVMIGTKANNNVKENTMEYLWMVFVGIAVLIIVLGLCGVLDLTNDGSSINPHLSCSHCGSTGTVTSKRITQKKGISGGKATGAIFTGGVSMLATGLSRKETATQMYCRKCGITWHV